MAFYINTNQQDCSREISVLLKNAFFPIPITGQILSFSVLEPIVSQATVLVPMLVIGSVPFVFQEYMFTEHLYSLYMH